MHKLFIPVILGTAREGRQSEKVAKYILQRLHNFPEVEYQLIDVREYVREPRTYAPGMQNDAADVWREIAKRADGFIIVTPEYNHGYPGELKLLIDMAETEYEKKVVGMVGVSSGNFGGVRVVEQMQAIFNNLRMVSVPKPLAFPNIEEVFDAQGNLLDQKYEKRVDEYLKRITEYTKDIKKIRGEK